MPTADLLRFVIGLMSILILGILIAIIALGKVEEKTSYGLMPLVVALNTINVLFAQWAFAKKNKDGE